MNALLANLHNQIVYLVNLDSKGNIIFLIVIVKMDIIVIIIKLIVYNVIIQFVSLVLIMTQIVYNVKVITKYYQLVGVKLDTMTMA